MKIIIFLIIVAYSIYSEMKKSKKQMDEASKAKPMPVEDNDSDDEYEDEDEEDFEAEDEEYEDDEEEEPAPQPAPAARPAAMARPSMEQSERHILEEQSARTTQEAVLMAIARQVMEERDKLKRQAEARQQQCARDLAQPTAPNLSLAEQAMMRKRSEGLAVESSKPKTNVPLPEEGGRSTSDEATMASVSEVVDGLTPDDLRRAVILDAIFKRPEF